MRLSPQNWSWALLVLALGVCAGSVHAAAVQTPLDPNLIPKFVDPLPIPGVLDGTSTTAGSPLIVTMSEFQTRILPASMYPAQYSAGTYVWGYNGAYPGPTIIARRGIPTHVKYVNNLTDPNGPLFLQSRAVVDQTLDWANPLGHPSSGEEYYGPVPVAVHLHGAEVPSAFDGGPRSWWTPGLAQTGVNFVSDHYVYPNGQQAATLFYHDHALGMTRLNLFAGLAGFYLLLDPGSEPDNLPGGAADTPADQYGHPYQLGVAIQDRSFDTDGQLYFEHAGDNPEHPMWIPEYFGNAIVVNGKTWPYLQVEPRRYRFRVLNGANARVLHMHLVEDDPNLTPAPLVWQIGTDDGLMAHPALVSDPNTPGSPVLTMASGERAELVIDFSGHAGERMVLTNDGATPYPDGSPVDPNATRIMQFRVGTSVTGGSDPSLEVNASTSLRSTPIEVPGPVLVTRALTINETPGTFGPLVGQVNNEHYGTLPTENIKIGTTELWEIINLTGDTHPMHTHLVSAQLVDRQDFDAPGYETEYGMLMEGAGPPMPYQTLTAATGLKLGGNPDVTPYLVGLPIPPDDNERGWKDTFRANPGQVTRLLVRAAAQDGEAKAAAAGTTLMPGVNTFDFEPFAPIGTTDAFGYPGGGGYVWHCHIVDHEDNDMMRPLIITGPEQVVATLVARFDASPAEDGVHVVWELSNANSVRNVDLQRSESEYGPWSMVDGQRTHDGTATVMVDRAAVGRTFWYRLSVTKLDGTALTFGPVQGTSLPVQFSLGTVAPNPSKGAFRIDFSVGRQSNVRLMVLDVMGRESVEIARGDYAPGKYSMNWNGTSPTGYLPVGIYFLRFSAPNFQMTRRIAITR